ncbi:alpha/beta-hydrolase [Byssothecium circinans]|uniref:Alpha/beta-hydrolase n=1 Tax=Byssothecium circinans TaxID=147558 RepID=A0A6A5TTR2_9PLEO|nr:alpha/beta-hydrolase [Byssothecium circinans]
MSLPTIVLIPGAWHVPQHYTPLIDSLKARKFDIVADRLPSVGSKTPREQSVARDADFIKDNLLLPIINSGKEVLLLMHSYGGCPGADAAKGLSKKERQVAGKKGGIVGLVFMCAFVAAEGDSLLSKLPGQQYDPWVIQNNETALLTVDNPKNVFYNLVHDATAEWAVNLLLPQSEPALSSPSGPPAWSDAAFDGKRAYIQTEQDHTIPFVAQDAMVTYSGVQWDVVKLNAGHSPFLSHTKEVTDFVVAKAKAYVG